MTCTGQAKLPRSSASAITARRGSPPWIDLILAGKKTWEIRSKPNQRTGRIALCRRGGPIVGTCAIGASIPLANQAFDQHFDQHRVARAVLNGFYAGKPVFAWPLSDVRPIAPPIPD